MRIHGGTSVAGLMAQLRHEIAGRQTLLTQLEAVIAPMPVRDTKAKAKPAKQIGMGRAALEILRAAGRPMHGLSELIPALEERGFIVKSRSGFGTLLTRTGEIVRSAPGTYAVKTEMPVVDASTATVTE